jgi:hypothetical protein
MARRWGPSIAVVLISVGVIVYGLGSWSGPEQPGSSLVPPPTAVVWNDRVFVSKAELTRWLRSRGTTYIQWAKRHARAQAILEHRPLPKAAGGLRERAQPPPAGWRSRHVSLFSGLWLLTCLALGAALVLVEQRRAEPPAHGLLADRLKAIRGLTEDTVG